ncbi:uncharacterized protein LOC127264890 [Andrographis paniculata]|uniref:uncharacterized protein LOC127264890 n=1 Tax=Andrographis paniculata TaxID=175694 RepID=UPI0021E7B512|nr:uncharacterized protein LOC127264890 [Andrographis paniculata]
MAGETSLSEHLHKLVVNSEQELESLLQLLWQTRKTGLSSSEKSSLQSLLKLPSPGDLNPVLPSLRSLIRNCARSCLEGDDISKLLPSDLPLELQRMLLTLLQKLGNLWKEELSQEQLQHVSGSTGTSCPNDGFSCSVPPPLSFPTSEVSGSLMSRQVNPVYQLYSRNHRCAMSERNGLSLPQLSHQNDTIPPEFTGVLPQVKSMTWTVENRTTTPGNRVAIITLKVIKWSDLYDHGNK